MGPGPGNPYPEVIVRVHPAGARPPRPRVPRAARRDQRAPAPGLPHRQRAHVPGVGHRLGRHGGVRSSTSVEPGDAGRDRRQRRVRRAHVRRRRAGAAPRSIRVDAPWGQPVEPAAAARRPPVARASSRSCTPRPRRRAQRHRRARRRQGRRAAARRLRHLARRHRASRSTAGASTSPTPAPRSASACRPACRRSPSSARARERFVPEPQSWYLDFSMIAEYVESKARPLVPPHRADLDDLRAARRARRAARRGPRGVVGPARRRAASALQAASSALGMKLFAAEGHRLPELTTVWVPDGIDEAAVRRRLLDRVRHRDRRRPRRVRRQGLAHRPAWATPPGCRNVDAAPRRARGARRLTCSRRATTHPAARRCTPPR